MAVKLAMHLGLVFGWTPCKGNLLWVIRFFVPVQLRSHFLQYVNIETAMTVDLSSKWDISGVSGLLKRSSPSRIVIVASLAHRLGKLDLDDLNFEKSFGGDKVYCSSKLANILMSNELARKLKGTGTLFKVSFLLYQCPQLVLA